MIGHSQKDARYVPICQREDVEAIKVEGKIAWRPAEACDRNRSTLLKGLLALSWIIVAILAVMNVQFRKALKLPEVQHQVFSPAVSAIKYKNLVTTGGVGSDTSPYQGPPSEENNQLWSNLYNYGISRIPMSEAAQLVNRTVPIPDDPGYYAVTLEVFHHLHCLNMIRQRIWLPDKAPEFGHLGTVHMDHCIDQLRESLMCSSDITPRPFGWNVKQQSVLPVNRVLRTCRDFDSIRDWARERQAKGFDLSVRVDDPLGNVEIDYDTL